MSADTTQLIPNTFCPGKWEELCLNMNYNYVYGCCDAKPLKFVKDFNEVLNEQKINLLNGIKDSSCNYCWSVEAGGNLSRRHEYLKKFNGDLTPYTTNTAPVDLFEINLGNECNFQCVYCNPKYSSVWEADVRKQQYKVFSDRHNYEILDKTETTMLSANEQILKQVGHTNIVRIIGGEPLYNKRLWSLLEVINSNELHIATNLSCSTSHIDRLLKFAETKFKKIRLQISLESTGEIAEFVRYGTDYNELVKNIEYTIHNAPSNVLVSISSAFNSISIRDLGNFTKVVESWRTVRPEIPWVFNYCINPSIQSFYTLPNKYREDILKDIQYVKTLQHMGRVEVVESALLNYKFNPTMHKEMKHFMQQFAERKNIEIPICLD